jgi:group I intron endonuclease
MVGVYQIRNSVNGKKYYGSSKEIEKRWARHKRELRSGTHINKILQRAWDKYGENSFVFEVVEECLEECLLSVEQKYLDTNPEYNIAIKSSGGDNLTKNPNKGLIVANITKAIKHRVDAMTEEERAIRFSKPMESNPNWRGGTSYVYCECGKRIGYGNTHCSKCRPRAGEDNPFYGKQHSEEFKLRSSNRMKGTIPGNSKVILIDGVEYANYNDAAKSLKIKATTIRWRSISKNPKYSNYQIKGVCKEVYTEQEQRERLSKPQVGLSKTFNKPFIIDEVEYRTLKEASEVLNIHPMTIKGRLKSDKFENYKYK